MWHFRYDKHIFLGLLSWLISLNSYSVMANTDTNRQCQQPWPYVYIQLQSTLYMYLTKQTDCIKPVSQLFTIKPSCDIHLDQCMSVYKHASHNLTFSSCAHLFT